MSVPPKEPTAADPQAEQLIEFINEAMAKPIDNPEYDLGIEVPVPGRERGRWIGGNLVEDLIGPPKPPYRPEGAVTRIAGLVVEDIPEGKGLYQRSETQREAESGRKRRKKEPVGPNWPPKVLQPEHMKPPKPCFCGAKFASWEECFAHRHQGRVQIIHFRFRDKTGEIT